MGTIKERNQQLKVLQSTVGEKFDAAFPGSGHDHSEKCLQVKFDDGESDEQMDVEEEEEEVRPSNFFQRFRDSVRFIVR